MYTCKHGCGYTNNHRGGMNMHESVHCSVLKQTSESRTPPSQKVARGGAGAAVAAKPKKEAVSRYCDCDGEPSWAFLDRRDPAQARAIEAGYKKVCTECGEVI